MTVAEFKQLLKRHEIPDEAKIALSTTDGQTETVYEILHDYYNKKTDTLTVFFGCELID